MGTEVSGIDQVAMDSVTQFSYEVRCARDYAFHMPTGGKVSTQGEVPARGSKKETEIDDLVTHYLFNFILNNKEIDINKIVILTLNNSQCLDFKKKLNQFNLPCKIQNKQNIFDTEASSLIFLLIECLLNPRSLKNITLLATSKFIEIKLEDLLDHGISNNLEILINKCITWSQELREKGFLNIVNELLINYKSSSIIQDSDLNLNLFQLSEIVEIELMNRIINNIFSHNC